MMTGRELISLAVVGLISIMLLLRQAWSRGCRARRRRHVFAQRSRWPSVSIVIPAWMEKGTIERCINSLKDVDYPDWECIVVASVSDGTYGAAQAACSDDMRFRVLPQLPGGKNVALNQGLGIAHGEVVVLLDADSIVKCDWLRALVAPLGEKFGAVVGNYMPMRLTPISAYSTACKVSTLAVRGQSVLQGSGSIAILRHHLEEWGGFDEDVTVGVDWCLGQRLAQRGIRATFAEGAVLFTELPASVHDLWRTERRWRLAFLRLALRGKETAGSIATLRSMVFYVIAVAFAVTLPVVTVAQVVGVSWMASLWLIAAVWWTAYQSVPLFEALAYSGEGVWWSGVVAMPLIVVVQLTAGMAALLAPKETEHFKGARSLHMTSGASSDLVERQRRLYDGAYDVETRWPLRVQPVDFLDVRLSRVFRSLPDNAAILDVGCGSGTLLLRQRPPDAVRYVGVDISIVGLARAREATAPRYPRAHFVLGEAAGLPLDAQVFDAIFAVSVIEHLPDGEKFLAECARVLKPEGLLTLHTPNPRDLFGIDGFLRRFFPRIYRERSRAVGHEYARLLAPKSVGQMMKGYGIQPTHLWYTDTLLEWMWVNVAWPEVVAWARRLAGGNTLGGAVARNVSTRSSDFLDRGIRIYNSLIFPFIRALCWPDRLIELTGSSGGYVIVGRKRR